MIGGYLRDPEDERDNLFSWSNRPRDKVVIKPEAQLWIPGMEIKGQGSNSCTGFAGSYALRMAIFHETGVDPGDLSGLYLYFTGRAVWDGEDKDEGSYIRTLFQAIEIQGACLESLFPQERGPFFMPGFKQVKSGFKHRGIKNYRRISTGDEAREALSDGIPLVGGWSVGRDFQSWNGGTAFNSEDSYIGGHAMCVSGYDQSGDFYLPNSWGDDVGEAGWWRVSEKFLTSSNRLWACDTKEAS